MCLLLNTFQKHFEFRFPPIIILLLRKKDHNNVAKISEYFWLNIDTYHHEASNMKFCLPILINFNNFDDPINARVKSI